MKKILKIFEKYQVCVGLILVLIFAAVGVIPFATKRLFGIQITPFLVLLPILLGIGYAIIVSYEQPNMSEKKKFIFDLIKAISFVVIYALTIALIVYAFI